MRNRRPILFACFAIAACVCACSHIPRRPNALRFPPLKFERPHPTRAVLSNGMVVYMLENHELPLVSAQFVIRTGRIYDPPDKIGLAQMTGTVLRTGGTEKMTGDQLDQRLEFLAAPIESSIGKEEGTASLSSLGKDLDETLGLLADILRHPRFAEDKIDLARKRMLEEIRRQNDQPEDIVSRQFTKLVFASSPAWGSYPTSATVNRITRDDLIAFHAKYYHPNNIIAGFSGDFDNATLLKKLEQVFGDWRKTEVELPKISPLAERNESSLNYVYKDIPQTYLQFGHLGIRRHNPDWYAVVVMNRILGTGGFTSRLMEEIRSNRGLAYSVGSMLTEDTDRGRFTAYCQTKSESTYEAMSTMRKIIEGMGVNPITDEEMDIAKSAIKDGFVFRFESPQQAVGEEIRVEYYGYPKDYLDTYIDKIMTVTKDDVHRVAKQYLHPDQMIYVLVGDKARFGHSLDEFGKMREIDLAKEK